MRSTMQEIPLSVARILAHGSTTHARSSVATWTPEGIRRKSFAQIGLDAARLANALRALGVDGDQRVASFMFNNTEHVTAYLAVPSMGAVLHTLNIRLAAPDVAYIASHAEDEVVIVDAALVPAFAPVLRELTSVRHVVVNGDADHAPLTATGTAAQIHDYATLLANRPETYEWRVVDERDAAALCYTSGTTGRPRGVAYSHRSLWLHSLQLLTAEAFALSDADEALVVVPQFHAMAWGFPYAAFMSGCSLLLPDRYMSAEHLVAMIEQQKPTYAAAVPSVWIPLLELADRTAPDLTSLREVVIGGSACPPSLIDAYEKRHGVHVLHAWGMTETSPLGSVARPPAHAIDAHDAWAYRVTQGRLPASVEGRLVGEDGLVLPADGTAVGELEVRGPWVTGSYLGGAAPEQFHDGWLRTGDVGTLTDDGYLTLTDRTKDVVKSGGEWISSVALENALMGVDGVHEAAVIAVPDERWGERPFAVVVRGDGADPTFEQLRAALEGDFRSWQVPEWWAWVAELPKTSTGKFDKKVLRTAHGAGELVAIRVDG